jgi:hypothetical protein
MKAVVLAVALCAVLASAAPLKFTKLTPELASTLRTRNHAARQKNANVAQQNTTELSVFRNYDNVVLGLQRCDDSSPWTIHGLWAEDNYCEGPSYSHSAIADLWSQLQQSWPTCSWSGNTEDGFLSHEWTKHGTCFNIAEHAYFTQTLSIYNQGAWKSQCDSESSNSCDVQVNM